MITNNARCTVEIKFGIAMAKTALNKTDSFHQHIRLKLKEETSKMLHLEHSFVWCWNLETSEHRSDRYEISAGEE